METMERRCEAARSSDCTRSSVLIDGGESDEAVKEPRSSN